LLGSFLKRVWEELFLEKVPPTNPPPTPSYNPHGCMLLLTRGGKRGIIREREKEAIR